MTGAARRGAIRIGKDSGLIEDVSVPLQASRDPDAVASDDLGEIETADACLKNVLGEIHLARVPLEPAKRNRILLHPVVSGRQI